ncbi:tripartite tricarboxylate transporter substrate binding protein [Roseomonas eburnea]|uniref:Tripartite tricarboxylate transporter substrate binding protein n=1 Tax=Neoroseomonas eburnea TaxID=1346889 RepID=A0A9X9XIJ7_9PROT|nr:tripartite tricarboxylate transporter substrate binding protein [Neoroseomonas eburnea]MBR0683533.1 tripartite tricarboxylate transporter substrate binding protein [Neoroseomonas eburnea]
MIDRRSILASIPAAAMLPAAARAQAPFPDRTVRYIVPFPPGGLTDIMARLVGQKLSEIWGKPVVIENRAGGNALIGADAVAKSAPDGHTLLAITMTHTVNATLFPNAPFNFRQDLTTVSVLGSLPLVVVVNAEKSPARTLAELMEMAKTRRLNAGSSGNGSPPHLGIELVRHAARAGDNVTHVPYRGGAPSVTDLAAGNLDFMVSNLPECIAQIQGGRLRPLAITSAARHPLLPEVPTVKEAGQPTLEMGNWTAMMVPAGVPAPILAKLEADTLAAIRDADVGRRARDGGFTVEGWDRTRSLAFVADETARWARVIHEAGLRAD